MLTENVTREARALGLVGGVVLVACSGGVDSVVLLHALHRVRTRLSLDLAVGHVDHGLRDGSAEDAAFVVRLAEKLSVPAEVMRVQLEGGEPLASRARPTLQERARRARYDALFELADRIGAGRLVTAHHLDDQAETVLLRLLRGSAPDGLAGIPKRSPDGRILRPLLGVPRAEIEAWARAEGLEWREDPSNGSSDYARNRIRHEWLPGLAEAFNPQLLRALGDLAEAAGRDAEWIGEQVERTAGELFAEVPEGLRVAAAPWPELPDALARRLVRWALHALGAGRDVRRVHLLRAVEFLREGRPGTRIELPGGFLLRRDRAGFLLGPVGVDPPGSC